VHEHYPSEQMSCDKSHIRRAFHQYVDAHVSESVRYDTVRLSRTYLEISQLGKALTAIWSGTNLTIINHGHPDVRGHTYERLDTSMGTSMNF